MSPTAPRVVVVGGGLAGMAAALSCADAGAAVTVLERRRHLGGLTRSFRHRGRWVDNGQHVFLRCCHAYRSFLDRIGAGGDVQLQDRLDVTVLRPTGGAPAPGHLRRDDLPAPLHLARSLLGYRHLPLADRLRLGLAVAPLRRLRLDDPSVDSETFAAWLARHGQSPRAVAALWDLICVPTVNLPASEASLAMAAKVFQTGLLTERDAADIGWSRVPLGRLHGERGAAALAAAGVEVRVGARVRHISRGNHPAGRFLVRLGDGTVEADAVVAAVPPDAANDLLPAGTVPGQSRLGELGTSPIVDVHLVYDRRVSDLPLLAAVDSPVQWVFDRTESSGLRPPEQYLAVSLSAADDWVGLHPDEVGNTVEGELARLLPAAGRATVVDRLVTKERAATFRARPGTAALRPPQATNVPGLAVAGAWTDTGWPATMEGAVRSGQAAATTALLGAGRLPLRHEEVA